MSQYPKDDDFYRTTQNKLSQLQSEYLEFIRDVNYKKPNSFIARYVKSTQLPIVDINLTPERQLQQLKIHALDNVDFHDAGLICSDVFTNKTIEYLTYYRNPQLPKELLEKEFKKAVDTILNKAKIHQIVYQHIIEYLIEGFKKFGFDEVLDYIIENYVIKDDLCLDSNTQSLIQRRIDQNKLLSINAVVPNIMMPDTSGTQIDISRIKSDKILILFYASWCNHCQMLIPQLSEFYRNQNKKEL